MTAIVSALIALGILSGIAAPARAFAAKAFAASGIEMPASRLSEADGRGARCRFPRLASR